MSFNQFMHPRNVFRNRPDYNQLADLYPQFREILLFRKPRNTPTVNYQDTDSLKLLTITLLDHYFKLKVDLPSNRLIPAVPQRLNYLLWLEDLMGLLDLGPNDQVVGVDIGTGACCIFPLLGCTLNKKWTFIATEADDTSYQHAVDNVKKNNLQQRIKVVKVSTETFLVDIPGESISSHFLMCNPPFFKDRHKNPSETESMEDSNDSESRSPSGANVSADIESITEGGEVAFVKKIIEESNQLRDSVKIYTVMLGHKRSTTELSCYMRSSFPKITSCYVNRFYQGKTLRWGLAWTYIPGLDLAQSCKLLPSKSSLKKEKPLEYVVPKNLLEMHYSLQSIYRNIRIMLRDELDIKNVDILRVSKKSVEMVIRSNQNTWSHQRRMRRMLERKGKSQAEAHQGVEMEVDDRSEDDRLSGCVGGEPAARPAKRKLSGSEDAETEEMDSSSHDEFDLKKFKGGKELTIEKDEEVYLLYCSCLIKKVDDKIIIEMRTKSKAKSKEATHQLLQYFKNHIL